MKTRKKTTRTKKRKSPTRNNPFNLGKLTSFENFVSIPKRLILEYLDWNKLKASE
jgi:hypothetical protein